MSEMSPLAKTSRSPRPRVPHARPSLALIAKELGVSIATVSRVLNDKPGISEDVRQKISDALQQHSYQRRASQPGVDQTGLNAIAFVVSGDLFESISHGDDFYGKHLSAVQKAIVNSGFYPLLITESQDQDKSGRLRCVTEKRVQGIIAESCSSEITMQAASEVPVVLFNRISEQVDSVTTNMRLAAQKQLSHLHELGHRSIACFRISPKVGRWENVDFWQQYLTFAQLYDLNLPDAFLEPITFAPGNDEESARNFVKRVVAHGATAIVTYDTYIPPLLKALMEFRIRVPEEVSLVGFNDLKELASLTPRITTYRQEFETLAHEAMRLLMDRIKHPEAPPRLVQIPGTLIVRESTMPPPRRSK